MSIFRERGLTICGEIGPNHVGSFDRAVRLIHAAKAAGADACKVQCYCPADLTIPSAHPAFWVNDGPWAGQSLSQLYAKGQTPYDWLPPLFNIARDIGLPIFASVFSRRGLDALEVLDCPAYKIASAEVADTRFVELVASTGKPVIISDGMATPEQMAAAMKVVPHDRLVVLKCVSEYPAPASGYNLSTLRTLQAGGIMCGVSDHTTDRTIAVMAATMGVTMLEKHLMASDCLAVTPLDFEHSLSPWEFARMVEAVRDAEAAMGDVVLGASVEAGKGWRRRLVAARKLPAGHTLECDDVRTARCGMGMEPDERYIGRTLTTPLAEGEPLTMEALRAA